MIKLSVKTTFKPNPNAKLTIPCPKCGHKGEYLITQLERDRRFTCSGCGASGPVTGNLLETLRKLRDKFSRK